MANTAKEKILEMLAKTQLALSPSDLAFNLDYNSDYVARQCKQAADEGLLVNRNNETNPFYEITEAGERFVREELD